MTTTIRVPSRKTTTRAVLRVLTVVGGLMPMAACSVAADDHGAMIPVAIDAPVDQRGMSGYGAYLAARRAQDDADDKAAAAYYRRALDADPTNGTLAHLSWYYALAAGQPDTAMPLASRAVALKPGVSLAALVLAIGDLQKGDYGDALTRAAAQKAEGLDVILSAMVRGWALVGSGKTDDAVALFKSIGAGVGSDPQVVALSNLHVAFAYDIGGKPDLAWDYYHRAINPPNTDLNIRAIQAAMSFLVRHDRAAEAQALVAAYKKAHPRSLLGDALARELTAAAANKSTPWWVVANAREGMAESLFNLGSSLAASTANDSARVFAQLALYLRPHFDFAEMLLGDIYQSQNRNTAAIAAYRQVQAGSLMYVLVRLRLAESLDAIDKTSEAVKLLTELEASEPNAFDVPTELGDIQRRHSHWPEAATAYRRALYLMGDSAPDQWNLYYSLGDVLYRGHQWPQAEMALKRSLELQPDRPEVLNYLGYSWIDRGEKLPEATAMLEKAVRLKPTDGYIIDSVGWAHYLSGDYKQAITDLEHAAELTPADPQVNDHLGDAYWRAGRHDEARFQWQRSLGLGPDPDEEKDLRRKLAGGEPVPPLTTAPAAAPPT